MRSIAGRLILFLLGPLLALLLIAGIASNVTLKRILIEFTDHRLLTQANALAAMSEFENGGVIFEFDEEGVTESLNRQVFEMTFQAFLPNGEIVREQMDTAENLPRAGINHTEPIFRDFVLTDEVPVRTVEIQFLPRLDVTDGGPTAPPGEDFRITLIVAQKTNEIVSLLSKVRLVLFAVFGFILATGSVLIVAGTKRGLAPLSTISGQVEQVHAATLHYRFVPEDVPREVRPLCEKLNELLERLESSFEREKRFTDDAAHELRTPVAELRALAEVLLIGADQLSEDVRQAFADCLEIAVRLGNMTEQLYDLAKCDSVKNLSNLESVDLAAELTSLWKSQQEKITAKKIAGWLNVAPQLTCQANRHAVQSILRNLLDNAAEYTPKEGKIDITALRLENEFEVLISNTTQDLESMDIERMFDRFWRKDAARSSSEHSGLGLSVVASFAIRLGWSLDAEQVGKRLVMRLRGPLESTVSF